MQFNINPILNMYIHIQGSVESVVPTAGSPGGR